MFPQFKKSNNESGIVLFIVLMTAIVIMILSYGILAQSMNEMNYAQQQIDQIASEQLAKGLFWNMYASGMNSTAFSATSENLIGRNYTMSLVQGTSTGGVTTYNIVANYDTF